MGPGIIATYGLGYYEFMTSIIFIIVTKNVVIFANCTYKFHFILAKTDFQNVYDFSYIS